MLRQWIKRTDIFIKTHPNSKTCEYFTNVYEKFYCDLFYESYKEYKKSKPTLFDDDRDFKKLLEEHFKIKL